MGPSANAPLSTPRREDLPLSQEPDAQQLDNIKAHLDIILLALEALAHISSEEMLKAAHELNLDSIIADRVGLWRLRQSNPLRKSSGGRKKLDVEEARSLVLIVCFLARGHHELIRRAVTLLEQITEQNKAPHQTALLGDYIDAFTNSYQERMEEGETMPSEQLSRLALKLLIDLLFYSAPNGHRRLWLALLDRAR
jgi:Protein of unknown function (DUF3038)